VSIIVSDISPMSKRGAYQGIMGASWGIAAVVGPIIGGALTERVSWRWCFYINLPTCGVAFVFLTMALNLNKPKGGTFAELRKTFDFVGLFFLMAAGALLIVGFSFAADHGFGDKVAIALIVVGGVLFFAACINCLFTKRNAVIPAVSRLVLCVADSSRPRSVSAPASSSSSARAFTPQHSFRPTFSSRSFSRVSAA
jgi:MFS family permease